MTKDGFTIESRQIVLCTGYELPKIVPTHGHSIASTWVIATKPQPKHLSPSECFIWEAKDPYLYVRATIDGRIICGGEDEEFTDEPRRDAKLGAKARILENKLAKLLPKVHSRAQFAGPLRSVRAKRGCQASVPFPVIRVVTPYWVMAATESHFQCSPRNSFPPQLEDGEIQMRASLPSAHDRTTEPTLGLQ